jgi:RHS repeat-associated protein
MEMKPRAFFANRHKETYYFSSILVILAFLLSTLPIVGFSEQRSAASYVLAPGVPQTVTLDADLEGETLGINPVLVADAADLPRNTSRVDFYYRKVDLGSRSDPTLISSDKKPQDGFSCPWPNIGLSDGPYELKFVAKAGRITAESAWIEVISQTRWVDETSLLKCQPPNTTGWRHKPDINPADGATLLEEEDSSLPALGPDIAVIRNYNSADLSCGILGYGWKLNLEVTLLEYANGDILLSGLDKTPHFFTAGEDGSYDHPVGLYAELSKNPDGTFTLTTKEEKTLRFDASGKLVERADSNGNAISYLYREGKLREVIDASGGSTSLDYDGAGHLSSITDTAQRRMEYTVNKAGDLVLYVDPCGNGIAYGYDKAHRLVSITEPEGIVTRIEYTRDGKAKKVTDAMGRSKKLSYGPLSFSFSDEIGATYRMSMHPMGRISESQKPNGSVAYARFDQDLNLTKTGDSTGFFIAMSYDERGNKLTQTDCEGNTERNVYQGKRLERHIDAEGHESRFEYDERGNLTREIDPLGNEKKHLYDARGNKIKDIDEEGYETAYTYDQRGNLTSTTDALGYTYTYKYDAYGHRVESSDFLGKVTRSEYDPLGRCIRNIDFKERTFEMTYDGSGFLVSLKEPVGLWHSYKYDKLGNLVEEVDSAGRKSTYSRDAQGHMTAYTDSMGNTTRYEYDTSGYKIKMIDALGRETRYEKNMWGTEEKTIYPNGAYTAMRLTPNRKKLQWQRDVYGRENFMSYDGAGNLIEKRNPFGTYKIEYDPGRNPVRAVGPDGNVMRSEYNNRGEIIGIIDERTNKRTTMTYDAVGRLSSITDANGVTTKYEYDPEKGEQRRIVGDQVIVEKSDVAGELMSLAAPDDYHETKYYKHEHKKTQRDALGNTTVTEYDEYGNAKSYTDACGNLLEYLYSPYGQLVGEKSEEGETLIQYDKFGRLLKKSEPNGRTLRMEYDDRAMTETRHDIFGTTVTSQNDILLTASLLCPDGTLFAYGYDDSARLASISSDAYRRDFSYDGSKGLAFMADRKGDSTILTISYEYGDDGLLSSCAYDGRTNKYFYDPGGRLLSWIDHEGQVTSYTYDEQGDMLQKGDERGTTAFLYQPGSNRLLSMEGPQGRRSFSFDANGSLTETVSEEGEKTAFIWDANNRLKKVIRADGAEITLAYDFEGRRKEKTDPAGNLTEYIYDEAGKLLAERDAEGNLIRTYVYANDGTPLELNQDGKTYFYHTNAHGDVLKLTDGEGNIVAEYSYDPWGKILSASGELSSQPLRYAGYFWDEDLSMYYLIARYYDPEIARFISTDPVKENFSGYIYCNDDPINMTDPMGTEAWFVTAFHITTALWYEFDMYLLRIKHNLAPAYYGSMITWETKAHSGLEGYGPSDEWLKFKGPIPASAHCRNPYNVLIWSSRQRLYSGLGWFAHYYETNGKWPPTLGEYYIVSDWWPIESPIDEWWIIWWNGLWPWFNRSCVALHTGWHGDPYGCHDYSSEGCIKLRPDRMYNFIWVWDMIVYTSWYNSDPYYYEVGAEPWLWCGGPWYDAPQYRNVGMYFYCHSGAEWNYISGWTG